MRQIPLRSIGNFYFLSSFILAAMGIFLWHPFEYYVLAASLIFVITAILLGLIIKIPHPHTSHTKQFQLWLKLWGMQSIGFFITLFFAALWYARFPYYGSTQFHFAQHLSLNLIYGAFFLANLLIMYAYLIQRYQKPISILLFFPDAKADTRLAIYGNTWFRKATMMISLLLFILSASLLVPKQPLNSVAILLSLVAAAYLIKSALFYRWLQIAIKNWRLNFANILLIVLAIILALSIFFHWFIKPFTLSLPTINLYTLAITSPLIVFWGFTICLVVPLSYLLAPQILALSAKSILFATLLNPILWLIVMLDYTKHLTFQLQHLPPPFIHWISVLTLFLSYAWLSSNLLAKLNALFFGNQGHLHQGPMSRLFVQTNLPIALLFLATMACNAVFWLQIDFLATAACVLISCIIAIYLFFKLVKKNER